MHARRRSASRSGLWPLFLLLVLVTGTLDAREADVTYDFAHTAALRQVGSVLLSPDGETTAWTVSVPRRPGVDEDGPSWTELHVARGDGPARAYVSGEVNVSNARFHPDGTHILYVATRHGDEKDALWALPIDGGESHKVLTYAEGVGPFAVSPDGTRIAFLSTEPVDEERKTRQEQGFTETVLYEDGTLSRVFVVDLPSLVPTVPTPGTDDAADTDEDEEGADEDNGNPKALGAIEGSVSGVAWLPDGGSLIVAVAPTSAVDDGYMQRRLRRVDATTGETTAHFANPGKLGAFVVSPDGRHLAMISAADYNDPRDGRLMVAPTAGGDLRDLLPGLEGHVSQIAWRDATTLVYVADIGTATEIGTVTVDGARTEIGTSADGTLPVITGLAVAGDTVAFPASRPSHPTEAFRWQAATGATRLSESNPWLASVPLAEQEVVVWEARDGLKLEGILIHPLRPSDGPAPLMMIVHGGPESHVRHGWLTSYSRPGQLAAARGYAVFYPNYRGSTGRGVAFSKLGQGDAAGPEFDDLVDALDHLIEIGVADGDRVGVTGGSYGGYATAWCATRFTDRFHAGVMFNGISNKHSKALTTDIPEEDRAVHTLYDPWTRAEFALERSPLNFVEQSRTPLLIANGTVDTRVHPSQSLQLFNALRLLGNAPVRLVQYPGEPHGNRRAAARDDFMRRQMRWMDHFVLHGNDEAPDWALER